MKNNRHHHRRNYKKPSGKKNLALVVIASTALASTSASALVGADFLSMFAAAKAQALASIATMSSAATAQIGAMTAQMSSFTLTNLVSMAFAREQQMGAIKAATAQNSASAQALAETQTKAAQQLATARQSISVQSNVIKALRAFGPSGQGYKACTVVVENKGLASAQIATTNLAAIKETQLSSAIVPKGDGNSNVKDQVLTAEKEFCAAGNPSCTPSSLPGGNVNAALLFTAATPGSKEALARDMFRQNIVNVNQGGLRAGAQVGSPMGQQTYFETTRQAALLSPAAYSLSYIDAQNTRTIDRDGVKYSANELIEKTVGRYYGGAEAKEWQAAMISQEPRGLLVEAARLNGLSVWLDNAMYQQNLRKEANLASILITASHPLAKDVADMGNRTVARNIANATPMFK